MGLSTAGLPPSAQATHQRIPGKRKEQHSASELGLAGEEAPGEAEHLTFSFVMSRRPTEYRSQFR